jgi:hypothetical protein
MRLIVACFLGALTAFRPVMAGEFDGCWSLTSPAGRAVWLKIEQHPDQLEGWMMWEIGSVYSLKDMHREGDQLVIRQPCYRWYMTSKGMKRDKLGSDTLRARVNGDTMTMRLKRELFDGTRETPETMQGVRAAPPPPAPDLWRIRFGEPLNLFNGVNLDGWRLTDPSDANAWSARNGILCNNPQLEVGPKARQFGNLRTIREFDDFRLQLELRLPPGGNSGIYLRGRYEVQVTDSYGREGLRGMGSVYSRIPALINASRPAGQWQEFDIMLVDRHVTVRLNNQLVIDNQLLEGCTGGALDAYDDQPGPIYFQGDHTAVEYRNIRLSPRVQ